MDSTPTSQEPEAMSPVEAAPRAKTEPQGPVIKPQGELLRQLQKQSQGSLGACYACKKCSNGCPLTFAMDLLPHQVVRYVQLGMTEALRNCSTIWICSACQTCVTRCPNRVDLPAFMDHLKEALAQAEGAPAADEKTLLFHRTFLREVKSRGRVFEGSLMARYMLASGGAKGPEAIKNARLGWQMLKRGRMKLLPPRLKDRAWLREIFEK